MKIKIAQRYFDELVDSGHTVPRDEKTGDTLIFKVGKDYEISTPEVDKTVTARCTQNNPCHLIIKP